jgi:hypothetical protein
LASEDLTGFFKREPLFAGAQAFGIAVADVDEEIRLDFRSRKEKFVDLDIAEPDMGPQSSPSARSAMIR